jgi:hypothetical protein
VRVGVGQAGKQGLARKTNQLSFGSVLWSGDA